MDDDGSTCIGWEGKMLRVGGLIPDVEFSAERNTQKCKTKWLHNKSELDAKKTRQVWAIYNENVYFIFFFPLLFGFFCRKDLVKGSTTALRYDSDVHGFGVRHKDSL